MAKNKSYRSKSKKDLNENYKSISNNNIIEYTGIISKFIGHATTMQPIYLKKPNGKNIIHLWWESKDKDFMNYNTQTSRKNNQYEFKKDSTWILGKDIEHYIDLHIRDGYKMYIKN